MPYVKLTTEQKAANAQQRKETRLANEPQFVQKNTLYYYRNREWILAANAEKYRLNKAYNDSDDEINFGVIQWLDKCEKAWIQRESHDSWSYRR